MVTVTDYEHRVSEKGKEFLTITIQGGVEVVESQYGNLYMTARKMSIPSTFDEQGCKLLLGKELPGEIKKVECEPYDYTNKNTGEIIELSHTYEYVNDIEMNLIPEFIPQHSQEQNVAGLEII